MKYLYLFVSISSLLYLTLAPPPFAKADESNAPPSVLADPSCAKYGVREAVISNNDQAYFSVPGLGEVLPERLSPFVFPYYQQSQVRLVDPLGDYALASSAMQTPKKIWWVVAGKKKKSEKYFNQQREAIDCAHLLFGAPLNPFEGFGRHEDAPLEMFERPEHVAQIQTLAISEASKARLLADYHAGRLNIEGKKNPLRYKVIPMTFAKIIADEEALNGITPKEGRVHEWDAEFKKHYEKHFFPFLNMSKILVALARGDTFKYMYTGKEEALQKWLVEQPYRSIDLAAMFRQSYRINGGDVYLTLLTMENLMSVHWMDETREKLAFSLRLGWMINHVGHNADNFGAWYHSIGLMLYAYVTNGFKAYVIGNTETVGSHVMSKFEREKQENEVNRTAGHVGAKLHKLLRNHRYRQYTDARLLDQNAYINISENFSKQLLKASEER